MDRRDTPGLWVRGVGRDSLTVRSGPDQGRPGDPWYPVLRFLSLVYCVGILMSREGALEVGDGRTSSTNESDLSLNVRGEFG